MMCRLRPIADCRVEASDGNLCARKREDKQQNLSVEHREYSVFYDKPQREKIFKEECVYIYDV